MAGGRNSLGPKGFLTEEEKQNMPKVTKELLLRILSYLKPYWLQFLFVFVAILLSATVGLLPSIITGRIVDQALVGKDLALLIRLLIMAFCSLGISQLIGVLESYINSWISQRIIYDMKNQMYRHLQYMPHSFFTTEKQGDIITRMNTDISGVSTVISGTLSSIVSNTATVVTTLVALFSMSWQLALVGIAIIPLLILPTRSAGKTRWMLLSESQAKNDEMNQVINETLSVSGSMLVKIFTCEEKEYEKFVKVNGEATEIALKERRSGKWFMVVMGMFSQLGPLLIYFVGGLLIINRWDAALSVGTITATVSLINRLYRPVESLLNLQVDFTRSLALFTRIFDYFDRENTIVSPENGQKPDVVMQPIEYKHVAFSYDPAKPLLTDVNFTVPGGKMYAIVGPSGSGKSTVVHEFILKQPEGYNTPVGNRGLKLSGGEKQRISLARVILKDPKILILDEATSALDSISENAIQDALEAMMKGRTSIVIAHRLSTILKADRILVVKDGVISEQGTHEELLALGGTYRELFETQFRQAMDYEPKSALDIASLSTAHQVRAITQADISDVYALCKSNQKYYARDNTAPTVESLTQIISRVPEGAGENDKHFVGFYTAERLVAVLDLITGYPKSDDAFIGWFMVDGQLHRQGIGSQIFADVRAAMAGQGYDYLALSCEKENGEACAFWKAQGFRAEEEDDGHISFARDI